MNPKLKSKWIKALESGKYKQTQGKLRGACGYCCLGVLCDIIRPQIDAKWEADSHHPKRKKAFVYNNGYGRNIDVGTPGPVIRNLVGISDPLMDQLVRMNDDEGATFKEIAQYIKENL